MVDNSEQALLARQQELTAKDPRKFSPSEAKELNSINETLRRQYDYKYGQAPRVSYSGGKLNVKSGIGGVSGEYGYGATPDTYLTEEEQKSGVKIQQDAVPFSERVKSEQQQQRETEQRISSSRLFQGLEPVASSSRGDNVYRNILTGQTGELKSQQTGSNVYSERFAPRKSASEQRQRSAFESSLEFAGLSPVATSESGKIIVEQKTKKFLEPTETRRYELQPTQAMGSNLQTIRLIELEAPKFQGTVGLVESDKTKAERIASATKRFASAQGPTYGTPSFLAQKEPGKFIKAGVIGTGLLATQAVPILSATVGGIGGTYTTAKEIKLGNYKTAVVTGALTAVDLGFLAKSAKTVVTPKLVSRKLVSETPFEFDLPTRAGVKGTPVLGKQQNIVSINLEGDKTGIDFLSRQKYAKGSRILAFEEQTQGILGKQKNVRLVEQNIKIKNFQIKGSNTPENFEIGLTGQSKVGVSQRTLAVPASSFELNPTAPLLGEEILTPLTKYTFAQEGSLAPLSFAPQRDLVLQGGKIVRLNGNIASKNLFSFKKADQSLSPFATGFEKTSGRAFVSGQITPLQPNLASVGLRTTTRLNIARQPTVLRSEQQFLNKIQAQKPEFVYKDENVGQVFEVSGRTPTKSLTSIGGDNIVGELISRETSRVRSNVGANERITSTLQLQRGQYRKGPSQFAPLFDVEDFKPFTDTLTSRPNRPPKVNQPPKIKPIAEQFGVSQETLNLERLANAQSPSVNIFDTLGVTKKTSAKSFGEQLSRVNIQPSFGNVLETVSPKQFSKTFNAKQSPRLSASLGIPVAQQTQTKTVTQKLFTPLSQNKNNFLTNNQYTTQLISSPLTKGLLKTTAGLKQQGVVRLKSKPALALRTQSRLNTQLTSRLATESLTRQLTQQNTRQLTRQATRQLTRQNTRQLTRQLTRQTTRTTPVVTPPFLPPNIFPPSVKLNRLPRGEKKKKKGKSLLDNLTTNTKYTPTAYALGFNIKGKKLKGTLSGLEFRGV